MELDAVKKLIKEYAPGHAEFVLKADIGERYYKNDTDINYKDKNKNDSDNEDDVNPLRNADNRIPHGFHGLLVDQKAAYMFTYPPLIDVGTDASNKKLKKTLGKKYSKICKKLCVNASNMGVAWLHYWVDQNNKFHYGVVDSRQIIPIWTDDLDRTLKALMRQYHKVMDDGKTYIIYEIWTENECESYCKEISASLDLLRYYSNVSNMIIDIALDKDVQNTYKHGWGRVPFIPFYNNDMETSDLDKIKKLIDSYDKVYSGFVDDLEDIQEIIFILSGYDGTDLNGFLQDLKKYKTVKMDSEEGAGLSTLTIDIPVEAREKILSMTRKEIFEQGQGVDPLPENYGNASGEALKFMYTLLELKAGLMETEFAISLDEFMQELCKYLNINCEDIEQTWTRNMIRNDAELATMCAQSDGIISQETIVKNHPFVEDPAKELKQIQKEKDEAAEREQQQMYGNAFKPNNKDTVIEDE